MTDKAWGCVFMIGIVAITSLVFYGIAYFILGFLVLSDLTRTALSLLLGISGALGAQWFLATMNKE
ncbi:MAG: hypothetical protein HY525_20960 [Betaproteobacteria bacterium]|nr:hypothetical protein [Betaproteobacteria bacterium]